MTERGVSRCLVYCSGGTQLGCLGTDAGEGIDNADSHAVSWQSQSKVSTLRRRRASVVVGGCDQY